MRRLGLLFFTVWFVLPVWSKPLPRQNSISVILDTDGAVDDLRAMSFLLSRPEVVIQGILLSDGSLTPAVSCHKVWGLLHAFGRDSVPVGLGPELRSIHADWQEFDSRIDWGAVPPDHLAARDASVLLPELLNREKGGITLVCLGPLTNLARVIRTDSGVVRKIDRVVWYTDVAQMTDGFNYTCDPEAAREVMASGLKMIFISALPQKNPVFDMVLFKQCLASETVLGQYLAKIHSEPEVKSQLEQGHFRLMDELVALYLLNPELFDINTRPSGIRQRYDQDFDTVALREVMADLITGNYTHQHNVVFGRFPVNRGQFTYDVRQIMDSAMALYGPEEWKANVMTDEFHGHLGVYSIVGAKMGIRAREWFGVGPDQLEVISYAGLKPPYSCLTDGLQVSTGATLGMGTISVASDSVSVPAALFKYNGHEIRITLKPEYVQQVDQDINEGIVKFGLLDDGYWKLVRRNAIRYWLAWDRNKIFNIAEIR